MATFKIISEKGTELELDSGMTVDVELGDARYEISIKEK